MSASVTKITLKSDKKLKPPSLVNINSTTTDSGLNDDSNDDWWDSPFDFSIEKMNHQDNRTDSFSNLRSFWQGRVRAASYPTDSKTQLRQLHISLNKEVNKIKMRMTRFLSYLIAQLQKLSKSIVIKIFFSIEMNVKSIAHFFFY